jgi:hypothetical protein
MGVILLPKVRDHPLRYPPFVNGSALVLKPSPSGRLTTEGLCIRRRPSAGVPMLGPVMSQSATKIYHAVRATARSLAGEVQGLEPTVGRLGPMVATESSVPPVFTTNGRMTLVSSWTTLCRGGFGSRRGMKRDATFPRGTQAPLSLKPGLPEGQTPRDDIVGHHFGAKNSMFFHAIISNCSSREREGG